MVKLCGFFGGVSDFWACLGLYGLEAQVLWAAI
jgi:hypothetical protein